MAEETRSRLHEELAEAWEDQPNPQEVCHAMLIETMKFSGDCTDFITKPWAFRYDVCLNF